MSSTEKDSIIPLLEDMDKHIQEHISVFNKPWHDTDRLMKLYKEYRDTRIAAAELTDKATALFDQVLACINAHVVASDMYATLYGSEQKGD